MYFFFFATAFIFFPHLIPFFFYQELEKIAAVNLLRHRAIISLIGNVQRLSLIIEKVLYTFCTHTKKISFELFFF